jgi:putative protease
MLEIKDRKMTYQKVGKVVHYFDKILVAVIEATDGIIKVGDMVRIGEEGTGIEQKVESMQVEHAQVESVAKGKEAALKVTAPVKSGNIVYKISE